MPKLAKKVNKSETPEALRPYVFHGLDLDWGLSGKEAIGDCIFCGKENKFSINTETGQWQCFRCQKKGGVYSFIKEFWELCDNQTTDYSFILEQRNIDVPETAMAWGICKSITSGRWLLPGWNYDSEGHLRVGQLYVYTKTPDRWMMMPTPNLGHAIFGLDLFDPKKEEIYLAEGPWDAIKLWESLRQVRYDENNFSTTKGLSKSLSASANVLGTPSTNLGKAIAPLLKVAKGKTVNIWFDNDHPRVESKSKTVSEPAGYAGCKRLTSQLCSTTDDILYLKWGKDGYDPKLKDGYDLRDCLTSQPYPKALEFLFSRTEAVPKEWLELKNTVGESLSPKPCSSWKVLVLAWRKALKWNKGLDHGLASMLASIASTNLVGDQLWLKIIGPASCGKSTLCEAVSVNKKHILPKSTIRGFHSGYSVNGSGKDNSLISVVGGKTLVTKDGDTLLQSPNLSQILSEARDVYDCVSRTHYRNAMSKDYEGIRMTWLLCGTNSLRALDTSELGQRFLDCVIMEDIDEDQEDEVLWRVANKSARQVTLEVVDGDAASQQTEEMTEAMRLTAGYIDWLKKNTGSKLEALEFSHEALRECTKIGKFVAYMRARPSKVNVEKASREFAARLVSQHTRLARCLALVLNRKSVDEEVLKRVRQIGLDTARGIILQITRLLYETGDEGRQIRSIHMHVDGSFSEGDIRGYIRFMRQIGIVELASTRPDKWRLTNRLDKLCTSLGFGEFDD